MDPTWSRVRLAIVAALGVVFVVTLFLRDEEPGLAAGLALVVTLVVVGGLLYLRRLQDGD